MTMNEIEKAIKKIVKPFYALNDKAHSMTHAMDVVRNVKFICKELYPADDLLVKLAVTAAWLHDIKCHESRKLHNELAYEWVLQNPQILIDLGFLNEDVSIIAKACMEHRSSYKDIRSLVGDIVAAADRGPSSAADLPEMVERATTFGIKHFKLNSEDALIHAHNHMHEKFGRGSDRYDNLPKSYVNLWGNNINGLWNAIDKLPYDSTVVS